MAHISIKNLTVEFKVYGSNSRSLKKQVLSQATGGRIAAGADDAISVKALDNVSLEIADGDRVGLIGHNGAGKSTFLRTLAGIYKPTQGSIEIEGMVGTLIDPAAGMDPEATGIENIFLRGSLLGLSRQELKDLLPAIAELTELGNFLELPVKSYSAGMYARLGFAISMAIRPPILVLDEVVGAGDQRFQSKIQTILDDLMNSVNILILATHDSQIMDRVTNRTIELESGKIK